MPELPEVEHFRQLLLPLVGNGSLKIEAVGDNHRIRLTDLAPLSHDNYFYSCTDVWRRGKQLCLVLTTMDEKMTKYLFLHMGMTGRIRVQGRAENWGGKKVNGAVVKTDLMAAAANDDESFPPMYTYLVFTSNNNNYTAYFCDPRKFGSCYAADNMSDVLDALAPDALTCKDQQVVEKQILPALSNQRLGIKAVLLDQKRAVSGVGNWVADEVLYQCQIHPDQTQLTNDEAAAVWQTLQSIVTIAANALKENTHYPETWLFSYRWTKKKATKDAHGRTVTFLTSGGRTSAIVASAQKLRVRKKTTASTSSRCTSSTKAVKSETLSEPPSAKKPKRNLDEQEQLFNRDGAPARRRAAVNSAKTETPDPTNTNGVRGTRKSSRVRS